MEWLEALRGTVVGLDTAPLIYFIEQSPEYLHIVRPFFRALDAGELRVVTSTLTLTEVLVHPLRRRDSGLANQYRRVLLSAQHLETVVVSHTIAESAAQLRSTHGLRTPDAIQLATALASGASSFFTNDARLQRSIQSINIVVLSQLAAPQA